MRHGINGQRKPICFLWFGHGMGRWNLFLPEVTVKKAIIFEPQHWNGHILLVSPSSMPTVMQNFLAKNTKKNKCWCFVTRRSIWGDVCHTKLDSSTRDVMFIMLRTL
jgi:hypothetical protein